MLRKILLASTLAVPMALAAHGADAVAVTFSSNGSFAAPTGCSANSPACTVDTGGNRLILGTSTFIGFPTTPYSTLTAIDVGSTSTSTPQNDFRIGEIDWTNVPTTNSDSDFNDVYTLTLSFTAPGAPTNFTANMSLRIQQPINPPGDSVTQLLLSNLTPFDVSFNGLTVSDVKFVLGDAGSGGTFNAGTGVWFNPENNTSKLYITADFSATPAPEPISLALLGTGLAGLTIARRRRASSSFA